MTQTPESKPKCINCGYEIIDPNHTHSMPPATKGVCDHCGHDRNDPQDMMDLSCGCVCHYDDKPDVDITIITLRKEPDFDN